MATLIQLRRGTAAAWSAANPILHAGEAGVELDTGLLKIGDGVTAWASLAYLGRSVWGGITGTLSAQTDLQTALNLKAALAGPAFTGAATFQEGSGAGTYAPAGTLSKNITPVSNSGTGETDLMTFSLLGNSLAVNNQGVRMTAWGSLAANANVKTIKAYFGATVLINTGGTTASGREWKIEALVFRSGAATQVGFGRITMRGEFMDELLNTTPAATLSGAVTIKVTGQSAVGSGDVTCLGMMVEALP